MNFSVFTIAGEVINKDVDFVEFTSVSGNVGIHPNHTASLFECTAGELSFKVNESQQVYLFDGGIAHITPDTVSILTDSVRAKENLN